MSAETLPADVLERAVEFSSCHGGDGCIREYQDDACGDAGNCTVLIAIARAILAAKAEERDALLTLLAEAEDWDLGAFKDKGADYLIQSVQSRMFIRLDEAVRARGIEVNTAHKNSEEV